MGVGGVRSIKDPLIRPREVGWREPSFTPPLRASYLTYSTRNSYILAIVQLKATNTNAYKIHCITDYCQSLLTLILNSDFTTPSHFSLYFFNKCAVFVSSLWGIECRLMQGKLTLNS